MRDLRASPSSSAVSSVSLSNEYPSPAWPTSSSAVRPIHITMFTSVGPLRTRCSIASRSYVCSLKRNGSKYEA